MRSQTTVVLFCIVALLTTGGGQARNTRIVGGYDAELGQFLYQASLKVAGIIHLCGATIISGNYVVTGAHCLMSTGPEYVQVVVGTYNLVGAGLSHDVAQFIPHPEFEELTRANDIGLVETASIIVFGLNVQPISLGSADDFVGAGVVARATGWGSLGFDDPASDFLLFLDLVTLSQLDCQSRMTGDFSELITNETLCAYSNERGRGMCYGDSGGPLVADNRLIGLVSWCVSYAEGRPDVFTRISSYVEWINEHTGLTAI